MKKYTLGNLLRDGRDAFVKISVSGVMLMGLLSLLTVIAKILFVEVLWIWNALPF